jgi:hypothetical protein
MRHLPAVEALIRETKRAKSCKKDKEFLPVLQLFALFVSLYSLMCK